MPVVERGLVNVRQIDFERWIDTADPSEIEFRQAVHVVVETISDCPSLSEHLIIKGGILLALAHDSDRFTRDIDFSTSGGVAELPVGLVEQEIRAQLPTVVETLEYDLDCRLQSSELRPPDPDKSWPTLIMKVGYAPFTQAARHRRLIAGMSPNVVYVECSFNERICDVEILEIAPGHTMKAYAVTDVIAEKYRALIQQPIRKRFRRQDVYDLDRLVVDGDEYTEIDRGRILRSLQEKASSRGVQVSRTTLQDPEIRARAAADYPQLAAEIEGALPPFEQAYDRVRAFYEALPWDHREY